MSTLSSGMRVERYEVQSILGRGGMAVVALGKHLELGSLHALKVLHVASPGVAERMLQEGRVQATIDHPNVVGVRDVIRVHGMPCLVMEYVDGPSLNGVLYTFSLSYAQLDAIAYDLMEGLAAAHAHNLVHRDLKPHNVLLQVTSDRIVTKIADFGLAKVRDGEASGLGHFRTRSGQMMGTPSYMAPEQFNDAKTVDHRADIFALSAVLYEALTGEPPFGTDALVDIYARSAAGKFTPIEKSRPDVPKRIQRAIEAGLQPKAEDRPQTVGELRSLWQGNEPAPTNPWSARDIAEMAAIRDAEHALSSEDDGSIHPPQTTQAPPSAGLTTDVSQVTPVPADNHRMILTFAVITALAAILAGTGLGASIWWLYSPQPDAPAVADVGDSDPVVLAAPAPQEEPEPAQPEPAAVSAPVPTGPSPSPSPAPAPQPEPVAPVVTAVPVPVAAPRPEPVVTAPSPQPAVTDANSATVVVNGGVRTHLLDSSGTTYAVGSGVQPGDYTLWAFFDAVEPTRVLRLSLTPGERRTITCSGAQKICR